MTDFPALVTLPEAATMMRTTVATLRHWIRVGRLRAVKPGRRILVRHADLLALVAMPEVAVHP